MDERKIWDRPSQELRAMSNEELRELIEKSLLLAHQAGVLLLRRGPSREDEYFVHDKLPELRADTD